jgi:membrane protein DedA with SNARE-associated domain
MTERLLELLLGYGVVALAPVLLLSAIGVPLPGSLLVVAAGAFASAGQLSPVTVLIGAIVATLIGNGIGYWLGRRGGEAATARWARRLRMTDATIARAEDLFARYGGLTVLLSRFPLSPLSAIVNIIAGAARYPLRSFGIVNVIGVSVWASVYLGLGYLFGTNWESVSNLLNNVTQGLTLLVIVGLLAFLLIRNLRNRHARQGQSTGVSEKR